MAYFLARLDAKGREKSIRLERGKESVSWGRGRCLTGGGSGGVLSSVPSSRTDF